ncbi:MAG TPA: hypothetical protein VIF09_18255 [Polyangiaceae bacterium]|jgi:hypothetical protein
MKRGVLFAAVVAGVVSAAVPARAALTASEAAEVRGYVETLTHADRVRALVARPDLGADESAAVMTSALAGAGLDERRMAFLGDVVHGGPSAASRPVLAAAVVRALLGRAETIYAQHPADLAQSAGLGEIGRAYWFVAGEVSSPEAGLTESTRAEIAKALAEHFAREAGVLHLDVAVPVPVARLRTQAAISLLDAMPDVPTRRVDAADRLALTGVRRAALVETGILVTDSVGSDGRVSDVRGLLERLPGAREGVEAVFSGDARAAFRGKAPAVATDDAGPGALSDAASPWSPEAGPPAMEASTLAVARGLADAAVRRAVDRRPALRASVDHDGPAAVAGTGAMLAIDGPRTLLVAAARSMAGKQDTLAAFADALGALAVFAPPAPPADGLAVALGHGRVTHLSLEPSGTVSAFHFENHQWRIERDPSGGVVGLRRDGAAVTPAMFPSARVAATEAASWKGEGLVLARLSGAPRAVIGAGPKVRLVGSSVHDCVSTPAPADDVSLDADIHVDGAPGGLVLRALPGASSFKGVSLLLLPGTPAHALLLTADGSGNDLAAAPAVPVPPGTLHVHLVARADHVEATLGALHLTATLPKDLAHGDIAIRAYPGSTVEVSALRIAKP